MPSITVKRDTVSSTLIMVPLGVSHRDKYGGGFSGATSRHVRKIFTRSVTPGLGITLIGLSGSTVSSKMKIK